MKYKGMISFGLAVLAAATMSACGSTGKTDKAASGSGAVLPASKTASGESKDVSSVSLVSGDAVSGISVIAMDPANTKSNFGIISEDEVNAAGGIDAVERGWPDMTTFYAE